MNGSNRQPFDFVKNLGRIQIPTKILRPCLRLNHSYSAQSVEKTLRPHRKNISEIESHHTTIPQVRKHLALSFEALELR